jgi:hypothetical protein
MTRKSPKKARQRPSRYHCRPPKCVQGPARDLLLWDIKIASGTSRVSVRVNAVSAGGTQDGAITTRLWKSANANGSNATQITGSLATGSTVTNLAVDTPQTSYVDISIAGR